MRRIGSIVVSVMLLVGLSVVWQSPLRADQATYSCAVTVGNTLTTGGFDATAGTNYPPVSNGRCRLTQLVTDSIVRSIDTEPGCTVNADVDNDTVGEMPVVVGTHIPAGSTVRAYCGTGVNFAITSISLEDVTAGGTAPAGWTVPRTVTADHAFEPYVLTDSAGRIYFSATFKIFRSDDGGRLWKDITPRLDEALPTVGTHDTAIHVAPDDSLWFSRFSGNLGSTQGCTSTDHGESWKCSELAVPGVTDRMWVVGLSSTTGMVQSMQAYTLMPTYARTDDGSATYTPWAVSSFRTWNGNLVHDRTNNAMFQLFRSPTIQLVRVDDATGVVSARETGVPPGNTFPWLATHGGVLWTTGEPALSGGRRGLVAARSTDQGATWQQFTIPTAAQAVTFSSVAAGPGGRVALLYYGSDAAGDPRRSNGGNWSVYVAETSNALAATPTWTETKLADVHTGNVCAGLGCENTSGPTARFGGDYLAGTFDADGVLLVAYSTDLPDDVPRTRFMKRLAPFDSSSTTTSSTTTSSTTTSSTTTSSTTTTAPTGKDKGKDKDKDK